MKRVLLYTALVITPVACTSEDSLTQPAAPEHPSALTTATAVNSWSSKAAYPGLVTVEGFLAMAPNAAGQSIVYYLAGHPESEAEAVDGKPVKAYNVATDTWTTKAAGVEVWQTNGGGRIGSRIYFSGGFAMDDDFRHEIFMTGEVWAYDYVGDRMIRKTGMPIIAANGVSGVIGGKLYVLPGRCSGLFFPDPGYCSSSDTRRFFRYDPAVDRWVSRPWAPHNDAAGAAGVLQGRLYIVGGVNPRTGTATADLDMYDPATNEWRTLAPIPSAGRAIGAVIGNRFFVIVQPSTGAPRSYDYTPGTNLWRIRPAPSWENDGVVQVMLGGTAHLFAAGDADRFEDNTPNASELYTR